MSELATGRPSGGDVIEAVITKGDLSKLTPAEKTQYYAEVCRSVGLNPFTRPFEYISLSGKLTLYARREATDQLRRLNGISLEVLSRDVSGDILTVHVRARDKSGRVDEDFGAVSLKGLAGEALANANMRCVPLDTEILTRDGWKAYDQLVEGELILGYDYENDRTEWTKLNRINVFDAMEMGTLQTEKGRFSVRCTTGHRWIMQKTAYKPDRRTDGSRGPRGPYKNREPDRFLVEVQNIADLCGTNRLVLAAPETDQIDSILTPAEAAVLGWAVTDGTIKRRGNFVSLAICQSKEENFATIETTVAGVSDRWTKCVTPGGERTFPSTGKTSPTLAQHWWYLPAEISRAILARAGFQSRIDLPRIATRLNSAARQAMLQAFMLAEGSIRPHIARFINTDPSLMDTFQILCAMEGISTGVLDRRVIYEGYKPWMIQTMKKRRHLAAGNLRWQPETIEPAWCPTTDLGTWVMRQGGTVAITGNCITKGKRRVTLSISGLGFLDESEVEDIPRHERAAPQDTRAALDTFAAPAPDVSLPHTEVAAYDSETGEIHDVAAAAPELAARAAASRGTEALRSHLRGLHRAERELLAPLVGTAAAPGPILLLAQRTDQALQDAGPPHDDGLTEPFGLPPSPVESPARPGKLHVRLLDETSDGWTAWERAMWALIEAGDDKSAIRADNRVNLGIYEQLDVMAHNELMRALGG